MNSPKITCVITIDGDVWYEEKRTCRRKNFKVIEESHSIKRDKHILRLDKLPMERIKPVCDRQKCYENCIKKRAVKNKKDAKNRTHKDSKLKNKKHATRNKESVTKPKKSTNRKTKSGSTSQNQGSKKTKSMKKRPAKIKIKSAQNVSYQTTSTGTSYIEGLSPISCDEDLEFSYETISSDSFSDDEVDLRLLKTKERNKKQSKYTKHSEPATDQLSHRHRYSSPTFETAVEALRPGTPSNAEDNATVFSSEMDVSIHSLPTVVMSPRVDSSLYSPTTSPSELIALCKAYDDVSEDAKNYKTTVKTEPYDCKHKDWLSMSCSFDKKLKKEIFENEVNLNAGHRSIKNEPNNNEYKYSSTAFLNKKDCSEHAVFRVKREKFFQ